MESKYTRVLPSLKNCTEPTSLYDFLLSKTKSSRSDVFIPLVDTKDAGTQAFVDWSTFECGEDLHSNFLPRLTYENGDGNIRNLPKHNELLRILAESDFNDGDMTNLSFLREGIDMSYLDDDWFQPRLAEEHKRKGKRKVRGPRCSFCHLTAGKHQKWCVNYTVPEQNTSSLTRSKTEGSISLSRRPKEPRVKSLPKLQRSKTTYEAPLPDPDRPDYSTIHRDVYIRAMANFRAKRLLKKAYNFAFQCTKPFVFSYFEPQGKEAKQVNEMKRIFGKRQNFEKYYSDIVKEKEQGSNR